MLGPLTAAVVIVGCADADRSAGTTRPTTRTSDAALQDPWGNWSKVDTNISGSHTGDPQKEGLKGDLDRMLLK